MQKKELKPFTAIVPCPVILLSVGNKDKANFATYSWAANLSSSPPAAGVSVRKERYTYELLEQVGDFVLNIPSTDMLDAAILAGTKSGRDCDKAELTNITWLPTGYTKSPMIKECPLNIACKTKQVVPLGSHDLFIGEIVAVFADEDKLSSSGRRPDAAAIDPISYFPIGSEFWKFGERM